MDLPQDPSSSADASDLDLERPATRRARNAAGSFSEEEIAEEEVTHRIVPRVKPRTTDDLDITPPGKQRYPVKIGRALRELIGARELLLTFVERDLRVRYKQAVLGGVWAVLQPLMLMVVFTVVFGRIAKVGSEGLPYPVFSYVALVPYQLFSGAVGYGTNSIITNSPIIRKIYCPRETFPIAAVLSSGFDFLISTVILLGVLLAYGFTPQMTWLAYPLLLAVLVLLILPVTLFTAAVTAYFRDTRYGMPLLLQILLYATPVAYPLSKALTGLPPGLRDPYPYLNPLVPVMDGFRRALAHGTWPDWGPLASAAAVGAVALVVVYRWYKRIDRTFADVI